jgi:transposase-like protein
MALHRSHSIEFKRQIAQEFIAGETLHALAKRHDISRNLIRIWVKKLETGPFDEDARAADLLIFFRNTSEDRRALPQPGSAPFRYRARTCSGVRFGEVQWE